MVAFPNGALGANAVYHVAWDNEYDHVTVQSHRQKMEERIVPDLARHSRFLSVANLYVQVSMKAISMFVVD